MCGPLNSSLFKQAEAFLEEGKAKGYEDSLELWGKRAIIFGENRSNDIRSVHEKVLESPSYSFAQRTFLRLQGLFLKEEVDQVFVAYSSFKTALSQPPVVKKLLPIAGLLPETRLTKTEGLLLFEPEASLMLGSFLQKLGAAALYHFILEASVAEQAARMAAMDSATNNADKVIKDLTLEYNRARQASITKELIEITSGAEALN